MSGSPNDPARQFAAAWDAATGALSEWAQRVGDATTEAMEKLDPAVRAAIDAGRAALEAGRDALIGHDCRCVCGQAHPSDLGVCDHRAVMTRRLGTVNVPLCAPCAVAQGFAEMAR